MKAMVLAAGFGTRLGELTRDCAKPMLPIGGHPLLAYLLGHLRAQGFTEVAINLHFRPESIRECFGDGARWGMRLHYVQEERLLGTAGGVGNVAGFFCGESEFLVQYGDVITDQDFGEMVRRHRENRALATLLVHERARSNSVIALDSANRIVGFLERPSEEERKGITSRWVNSGVCVLSPEILEHIPMDRPSDLPRDVFRALVASGRLHAVPLSGYRCAIDSAERYTEAKAAVAAGRCAIQPLVMDASGQEGSQVVPSP